MDVLKFALELRAELQEKVTELDKFIAMGEALLCEDALRRHKSKTFVAPSVAVEPVVAVNKPITQHQPEPAPLPNPSADLPNVALSLYQGLIDEKAFRHVLRAERERRHAQTKASPKVAAKAQGNTSVTGNTAPIGRSDKAAASG